MFEITPESLSPETYFGQLESPLRERTMSVVSAAMQITNYLHSTVAREVELRIIDTDTRGAEGNAFSIRIDRGLLEFCMGVEIGELGGVIPSLRGLELHHDFVPSMALAWIFGHEWTHIVREHNEVAKTADQRGEEIFKGAVSMALEYDADLYAIAGVYRLIQKQFYFVLHDIDIRKLTVYCVFWTLRNLPQKSHDSVHPDWSERLFHIENKLIQISKDEKETLSVSGFNPNSSGRAAAIREAFVACEKAFQLTGRRGEDALLESFEMYAKPGSSMPIYEAWQGLSPIVEEISGTKADVSLGKYALESQKCIFCESEDICSTYVIPEWMHAYLPPTKGRATISDSYVKVKDDAGNIIGQHRLMPQVGGGEIESYKRSVNVACVGCKAGWIEASIEKSRPILVHMIQGGSVGLSEEDAQTVSFSVGLIMILNEMANPDPAHRVIPRTQHQRYHETNSLPEGWHVSVGLIVDEPKVCTWNTTFAFEWQPGDAASWHIAVLRLGSCGFVGFLHNNVLGTSLQTLPTLCLPLHPSPQATPDWKEGLISETQESFIVEFENVSKEMIKPFLPR